MSDEPVREENITSESDIIKTRKLVRDLAAILGFGLTDVTRIVTAASEITRNVFLYAGSGTIRLRTLQLPDKIGLELSVEDHGPGIADLDQAMQEGHSTSGGLGLGLPGAKRLMDEMEVITEVGKGTTVTMKKWRSI